MKILHAMKFMTLLLLSSAFSIVNAFQAQPHWSTRQGTVGRLLSTLDDTVAPSLDKKVITAGPKAKLLDIAYGLQDKFGVFIIDNKGQEDLRSAVEELESVAERPSFDDDTKKVMLGTWTLVCTTSSSSTLPSPIGSGIDTSKLPFFNMSPLKDMRDSLNKCLVVKQAILAKDSEDINRIDHILEYQPPPTLQDILEKLPSLNINPLDVTKGKAILIHEADVSNTGPAFSIRLKLASVVLNVAGTSQYLDPSGEDVLGLNSPLKEFQVGTFETSYLDENFRISRTSMGSFETLRVFVRSKEEEDASADHLDEEYFDEFDNFGQEDEVDTADDGATDEASSATTDEADKSKDKVDTKYDATMDQADTSKDQADESKDKADKSNEKPKDIEDKVDYVGDDMDPGIET